MMQVRCRPCGKKGRGPMIWSCINGDSSGGRPGACTPAKQIFAASGDRLQSLWSTLRGDCAALCTGSGCVTCVHGCAYNTTQYKVLHSLKQH